MTWFHVWCTQEDQENWNFHPVWDHALWHDNTVSERPLHSSMPPTPTDLTFLNEMLQTNPALRDWFFIYFFIFLIFIILLLLIFHLSFFIVASFGVIFTFCQARPHISMRGVAELQRWRRAHCADAPYVTTSRTRTGCSGIRQAMPPGLKSKIKSIYFSIYQTGLL